MITYPMKNDDLFEENLSDMSSVDLGGETCSLGSDYEATDCLLEEEEEIAVVEEQWCSLVSQEKQSEVRTEKAREEDAPYLEDISNLTELTASHESSYFLGMDGKTKEQAQVWRSECIVNSARVGTALALSAPPMAFPSILKNQGRNFDRCESIDEVKEELINIGAEILIENEARREIASSLQDDIDLRSQITILSGQTDDAIDDSQFFTEHKHIWSEETKILAEQSWDSSSPQSSSLQSHSPLAHRQYLYVVLCVVPVALTLVCFGRFMTWKRHALLLQDQLSTLKDQQHEWEKQRDRLFMLESQQSINDALYSENKCPSHCQKSPPFYNQFFCEEEQDQAMTSPAVFSVDNCWMHAKASFEWGNCPRQLRQNMIKAFEHTRKMVVHRAGGSVADFLKGFIDDAADPVFSALASEDAVSVSERRTWSVDDDDDQTEGMTSEVAAFGAKNNNTIFYSRYPSEHINSSYGEIGLEDSEEKATGQKMNDSIQKLTVATETNTTSEMTDPLSGNAQSAARLIKSRCPSTLIKKLFNRFKDAGDAAISATHQPLDRHSMISFDGFNPKDKKEKKYLALSPKRTSSDVDTFSMIESACSHDHTKGVTFHQLLTNTAELSMRACESALQSAEVLTKEIFQDASSVLSTLVGEITMDLTEEMHAKGKIQELNYSIEKAALMQIQEASFASWEMLESVGEVAYDALRNLAHNKPGGFLNGAVWETVVSSNGNLACEKKDGDCEGGRNDVD